MQEKQRLRSDQSLSSEAAIFVFKINFSALQNIFTYKIWKKAHQAILFHSK